MIWRALVCALALVAACGAPAPVPVHAPPPPTSAPERFEAVLRIDPKPGEKRFQGVWLERDGGEKWVISYRADPVWRAFVDHRVRVDGERYEPEGQAILAPHLRVRSLVVVDPKAEPMPSLIEVREERTLEGSFEVESAPAGSKLEGESWRVFVTRDGRRHQLAGYPEPLPAAGKRVRVRAREVVLSPYFAHVGGDALSVLAIESP